MHSSHSDHRSSALPLAIASDNALTYRNRFHIKIIRDASSADPRLRFNLLVKTVTTSTRALMRSCCSILNGRFFSRSFSPPQNVSHLLRALAASTLTCLGISSSFANFELFHSPSRRAPAHHIKDEFHLIESSTDMSNRANIPDRCVWSPGCEVSTPSSPLNHFRRLDGLLTTRIGQDHWHQLGNPYLEQLGQQRLFNQSIDDRSQ